MANRLRGIPFDLTPGPMSDQGLLQVAFWFAAQSDDLSTQNGALLARNRVPILETGDCNRIPDGVEVTPERLERPQKYAFTEHAERNAIYRAAKLGIATEGLTLVCPWAACTDCARAIISAGVTGLITQRQTPETSGAHWDESIADALQMLAEAKVEITWYDGLVGTSPLRRNGRQMQL